jgi:hypothetical protein
MYRQGLIGLHGSDLTRVPRLVDTDKLKLNTIALRYNTAPPHAMHTRSAMLGSRAVLQPVYK